MHTLNYLYVTAINLVVVSMSTHPTDEDEPRCELHHYDKAIVITLNIEYIVLIAYVIRSREVCLDDWYIPEMIP